MEPTIFKPRLKFKPPLKFFKFGHWKIDSRCWDASILVEIPTEFSAVFFCEVSFLIELILP